MHPAHVGLLGSVVASHLGVVPVQATADPHIQAPDVPGLSHVLADPESHIDAVVPARV